MTKPHADPPITLRLGKNRKPRFDAYRDATGLSQSGALHSLIDEGLDKFEEQKPEAPGEPN